MEIVIVDSGYKSYSFEKDFFESKGFSLKIFPTYRGDKFKKKEFARNADGILVRHTHVDEEFLSGLDKLKAIVRYGVGYDNIDVNACTKRGIKVANVQGYANHSVSEHALALMFACIRGMWNTKSQLYEKFAAPPVDDVFEIHDKTLGIIGLGRIGSEFCRKAKPLFKEVLATDPYKPDDHFNQLFVKRVDLQELMERSDVISLHCNLTEETTHLLNDVAFNAMKKKPVIINTSRGEIIDEKVLLEAINTDHIHSAGLDVYADEPLTEKQHDLVNHPRTICTGHYAWYSINAALELQKRAALNLYNFLIGRPVEDCLNCK